MNSSEKNDSGISSELQENINLLRQIDFFSSLQLEALKVIAYLCDRESFEPGDELISQDEDGGRAFYILSGQRDLGAHRTTRDNRPSGNMEPRVFWGA